MLLAPVNLNELWEVGSFGFWSWVVLVDREFQRGEFVGHKKGRRMHGDGIAEVELLAEKLTTSLIEQAASGFGAPSVSV